MTVRKKYWQDMKDEDFIRLGYKSGTETHQQLDSSLKLFCHCPARMVDIPHEAEILRHMRPTLSELGEYDGTALMEFKTNKQVIYQLYRDHMCTYEMDDTPPFLLNKEALDIALRIAMMLDASIVDEMHISRKQYLDGSIPTGFQRTAIVGVGGSIPLGDRKIGISHICLEEDACKEISDYGHNITFSTDRLSIPLVEVITHPEARTPRETQEMATEIHKLLYASHRVKRQIGAARSDVNVSIEGSSRVEIKGVYRLGYIENLCYNEALRQKALLEIRDELNSRGIKPDNLDYEKQMITDIFPIDKVEFIREVMGNDTAIGAIKLSGFKDILTTPTQPDITFASEFAGRLKVVSCLDWTIDKNKNAYRKKTGMERLRNLIHSEDGSGTLQDADWNELKDKLHAGPDDAVCIVWGPEVDVESALLEIRDRAVEACEGVPNETRQAFPDGTTGFERILPGPDRMYPDTDSPPNPIETAKLDSIRAELPDRPWEKEWRYERMGVHQEVYRDFVILPISELADEIIKRTDVDPTLVLVTLSQTMKSLRRAGFAVDEINNVEILNLFTEYSNKKFPREAFPNILKHLAENPGISSEQALLELGVGSVSRRELSDIADVMLKDESGIMKGDKEARRIILTGHLMRELRGKASFEDVRDIASAKS